MFDAATMHAMPKISWGQRDTSAWARPPDVFAVDDIVVCLPDKRFPSVPNVCETPTIADLSLQRKVY